MVYGPNVNAAVILLASQGNVPVEATAGLMTALLGVPVSTGFVARAHARFADLLATAGFDTAMIAALRAQDVLCADETPVNVVTNITDDSLAATGAPHVVAVRTPDPGLVWYAAITARTSQQIAALGVFTAWSGILGRLVPVRHPPRRSRLGRLKVAMRDGRDIRNEWTGLGPAAVTGRVRRMLADVVTANAAELEQRERRRHEHERQIRQWQKEQEEREREHQQREQERTRRWETAMATATEQAVAAIRHDIFRSAFTSWTRAAEIRRFCTVLEECGSSRGDLANWVAWGRAEADRIDPVVEEPSLADVSFDIAPTSNDLREFFDGWSSHRPDKENNRDRASAVSRRPSIEWLRRAARA